MRETDRKLCLSPTAVGHHHIAEGAWTPRRLPIHRPTSDPRLVPIWRTPHRKDWYISTPLIETGLTMRLVCGHSQAPDLLPGSPGEPVTHSVLSLPQGDTIQPMLVDVPTAAQIIGVTAACLDKWIRREVAIGMPALIRVGRARYFRRTELLRWLRGEINEANHAQLPAPVKASPLPAKRPRGRPAKQVLA